MKPEINLINKLNFLPKGQKISINFYEVNKPPLLKKRRPVRPDQNTALSCRVWSDC